MPEPVQTESGEANAEKGVVILDGPDGVAVTMTAEAARLTATSLKTAADAVLGAELPTPK